MSQLTMFYRRKVNGIKNGINKVFIGIQSSEKATVFITLQKKKTSQ